MVKELYGVELNFNNIPIDDKKAWDLISSASTLGIFQFSSRLAISVLEKVRPTNIEELAAANSFIRPGVIGLDEYVETKQNPQKVRKLHPKIDPIFEKTYGAMVFQEQLMQLVGVVMGIDFGSADIYRRMLEKPSKFVNEVAQWKEEFVQKGIENGFGEKLSTYLIDFILNSAGYSFNKSHAVCYSLIGYWTAYMKSNYPLVFYTSILNGNLEYADLFMSEARKEGIKILPPHVNHSKLYFTVEGEDSIRAGFNVIKGVGPKAVDSIIATQPYASIDDYFERNDKSALNKGVLTALIKSGCFENMGFAIESSDILEQYQDKFVVKGDSVYLDKEKMCKWYDLINELNARKPVQNFLVPNVMIKGKYFDQYEIIQEKDSDAVVIPEDRLKDIGLKLEQLPDKNTTRKKSKGSFEKAIDPLKSVNSFRKALILHQDVLSQIETTDIDRYLKECEEFGFSFIPHPLEKKANDIHIYDDVEDGKFLLTAGIIMNIEQRKTSKGKPYYWLIIRTPRDTVRVTVWQNQMDSYKKMLFKNNIVLVRGVKGFGGMSLEEIKQISISKL